ncbi:MAG: hypothetical protein GWN00_31375 [Aliifodinibius sp.]|nr:hypothetical protein [Fodinibius sp.]NIV15251.1 hypothetical protein [Fodinibius sp.]NIY29125.1 hypothetical protein [Fodinibius sp.]
MMKIALNTSIADSTRTGTGHYAVYLTPALMGLMQGHELVNSWGIDLESEALSLLYSLNHILFRSGFVSYVQPNRES